MYTDTVLHLAGRPEYYGAPAARATVAEAGITLCQHFLPLVAEGRIDVHPWMTGVDGQLVRFCDGDAGEFDAILFGTGLAVASGSAALSATLRALRTAADAT